MTVLRGTGPAEGRGRGGRRGGERSHRRRKMKANRRPCRPGPGAQPARRAVLQSPGPGDAPATAVFRNRPGLLSAAPTARPRRPAAPRPEGGTKSGARRGPGRQGWRGAGPGAPRAQGSGGTGWGGAIPGAHAVPSRPKPRRVPPAPLSVGTRVRGLVPSHRAPVTVPGPHAAVRLPYRSAPGLTERTCFFLNQLERLALGASECEAAAAPRSRAVHRRRVRGGRRAAHSAPGQDWGRVLSGSGDGVGRNSRSRKVTPLHSAQRPHFQVWAKFLKPRPRHRRHFSPPPPSFPTGMWGRGTRTGSAGLRRRLRLPFPEPSPAENLRARSAQNRSINPNPSGTRALPSFSRATALPARPPCPSSGPHALHARVARWVRGSESSIAPSRPEGTAAKCEPQPPAPPAPLTLGAAVLQELAEQQQQQAEPAGRVPGAAHLGAGAGRAAAGPGGRRGGRRRRRRSDPGAAPRSPPAAARSNGRREPGAAALKCGRGLRRAVGGLPGCGAAGGVRGSGGRGAFKSSV